MIGAAAAVEWATTTGPPNWLFVLALLTHPKTWSDATVRMVRRRFVDGDDSSDAGGEP